MKRQIIIYVDFERLLTQFIEERLLEIFNTNDIPPQLWAIGKPYKSTIAKVIEPVGKTDYFEIKGSILQGAPLPFVSLQ